MLIDACAYSIGNTTILRSVCNTCPHLYKVDAQRWPALISLASWEVRCHTQASTEAITQELERRIVHDTPFEPFLDLSPEKIERQSITPRSGERPTQYFVREAFGVAQRALFWANVLKGDTEGSVIGLMLQLVFFLGLEDFRGDAKDLKSYLEKM